MAAVIDVSYVNQFLPKFKLEQEDLDIVLERSARNRVYSEMSQTYDVSEWTGPATTPPIVKDIIGMFVAGWVYNRQHAQEAGDNNGYANRLLGYAASTLRELARKNLDLLDENLNVIADDPILWDSVPETEPVFEMGRVF